MIPTVNGVALAANSDGKYLYTPAIPKTVVLKNQLPTAANNAVKTQINYTAKKFRTSPIFRDLCGF